MCPVSVIQVRGFFGNRRCAPNKPNSTRLGVRISSGAPFRIKLRTHMSLKSRYKFSLMARYPLAMLAARPPPPAKRGRNYNAAMDLIVRDALRFGAPYSGQLAPNIGRETADVTLFAGDRLGRAQKRGSIRIQYEASPR